jgi:lysyl-tRNA synthetase class 2
LRETHEPSLPLSQLPATEAGRRLRVGGRVLHVDEHRITLADALATAELQRPPQSDPRPGDLIEASGLWDGSRLVQVALLSLHRPTTTFRPEGDIQRFLLRGVGHNLQARARVIAALRGYFSTHHFLEVETPILVPCPGLDLHLDGCAAEGGYLITSPEYQMKRLLTGGLPRLFQLARCFRKGELGQNHNPEFTMLEWYRAFAGHEEVMADTEALVRAAAVALGGREEFVVGPRRIDLGPPFLQVTVAEAFARYTALSEDEMLRCAQEDEDTYFRALVEEIEPALAALDHPVFLMDYPASQASLARKKPGDPRYAERFELYVAGVELCNGFGELTDPAEQRARFEHDRAERGRRGLPVYPLDERFLLALEEGMPPAGGNALGLDRLVALACGASSLAEVQAFPAPLV